MKRRHNAVSLAVVLLAAGVEVARATEAPTPAAAIRRKLDDPAGGVFVVAHRGCHNRAPSHGLASAPENSLAALEGCVRLGVDMMETDVRRSRDGALVILHDATVDRTTDGRGRVADLTLAQIRRLRLRRDLGGAMSPQLTDQRVPTLDELLAAARGRIMLNLDVKDPVYAETIAAAVRAGVADEVLVKSPIDAVVAPVADTSPFHRVSYMPIIWPTPGRVVGDLERVALAQTAGRRRVPAIEMVGLDTPQFEAVRRAAQRANVRLWADTLTGVGVLSLVDFGGDLDALRDPAEWDRLLDAGVSAVLTDEPGALIDHLKRRRATTPR